MFDRLVPGKLLTAYFFQINAKPKDHRVTDLIEFAVVIAGQTLERKRHEVNLNSGARALLEIGILATEAVIGFFGVRK